MPIELDDAPLRHTARSRLAALTGSSRAAAALAAETEWLERCPAYADARGRDVVPGALRAECDGLVFQIPPCSKPSRLITRLMNGLLPWRDLLVQGALGGGTITLDIGANIGTTALTRIVAGDAQRVYAAEPDPTNYVCLVHNIITNGLRGFVLPDAVAISDRNGQAKLRIAKRMANHQLVDDERAGPDTVAVTATTLDSWVSSRGIQPDLVSLIKLDVQGWEGRALLGAPRLLTCRHIAWAVEVSPKHLATAGTPLAEFCDLVRRSFTHAIDCGRNSRPFRVCRLSEQLAYLGEEESFTDLLLYTSVEA